VAYVPLAKSLSMIWRKKLLTLLVLSGAVGEVGVLELMQLILVA
jgi:hypothetical protein